jgi:tetratricopeptide (TPR) repeat protein
MDENRLQAYLALIQELLSCPIGEELAILKTNGELVDPDLVKTMEAVASQAEQQKAVGTANFLRNLAEQLNKVFTSGASSDDGYRAEAYVELIDELLNCPSGEEVDLLNKNSDLLDTGFVIKMTQVAAMLADMGEQKASDFLNSLVPPVAQAVGLSLSQNIREEYLEIIGEVLEATASSNGDDRIVYPILEANIDKLDKRFAQVLTKWAIDVLSRVDPHIAQQVASTIVKFSRLIQNFPLGNRLYNLEIAIAGYKIAAKVFDRKKMPERWAEAQNYLGNAYRSSFLEEQEDNLERAIRCYRQALKVYSLETHPEKWAETQNYLGNAFSDRHRGNKADNLEKAIKCYRYALKVYTLEETPKGWAATQIDLGNAYIERVNGVKAENLDIAMKFYISALEVYTKQLSPIQWAMTQKLLGQAYFQYDEDRDENLELAIECFELALEVYTVDKTPDVWAETQNYLGNIYLQRIAGEKAENVEAALEFFQEVLKVYTKENTPVEWAMTQYYLGNAYSQRMVGKKSTNLAAAAKYYRAAFEVYKDKKI